MPNLGHQELLRRATARAAPGEVLEVVVRSGARRRVRVRDGVAVGFTESVTVSTLVRSSGAGTVGAAATSRLDGPALEWAVERARQVRRHSRQPAPSARPDRPLPAVPDGTAALEEIRALSAADVVADLVELGRQAAAAGARGTGADWNQNAEMVFLASSAGPELAYAQPEVAVALSVSGAGGAGGLAGRVGRGPRALDRAAVVRDAVGEARDASGPAARLTARDPDRLAVVLAPRVWARLLAQVGAAFYGDRPDLTRVGLRTVGRAVLPAGFSLVDDGTDPDGLTLAPCDDEGTASGRTAVVQDGVLCSLLHDRSSAGGGRGEHSTGNGWVVPRGSGVGYGIAVAAANLRLAGPELPLPDLLARPELVLYASRLDDGGGRGVDVLSNSLRVDLSGWLLRRGERVGAVSGAALSVPLEDFLLRLAATAPQRHYFRIGAAATLRRGPAVAGTQVLVEDLPVILREAT